MGTIDLIKAIVNTRVLQFLYLIKAIRPFPVDENGSLWHVSSL
jgi:hypothetical protein